jgi:hypothetical protein
MARLIFPNGTRDQLVEAPALLEARVRSEVQLRRDAQP